MDPGSSIDVPAEAARMNIDRLGIKYDELPSRPFWASFFGPPEAVYRSRIAAKIMSGSVITGRELTSDETDALAQHFSALLRTQEYEPPISSLVASTIWWRTYSKYSFPFWTPNPKKFNPNKFLGVEGASMRSIWHSLRFLAWYSGCKVVIAILITSSATSSYMQKYLTDPRLVDYRKAAVEGYAKIRRGSPPQVWSAGRQQLPAYSAKEESSESWPSTEDMEEQWKASTPAAAAAAVRTRPQRPPTYSAAQNSSPEDSQDAFAVDEPYTFDDASPVAPAQQKRGAPQPAQGGSAWDRIRRGTQAQASNAAADQGSTQQAGAWARKRGDEMTSRGAQDGTSYTYSSGDEQKSYAKEQSQKEFDEMLERERRGEASGRR